MRIRIEGMGLYAPGEPIGNEELKKLAGIDFKTEKIENKIGIKQRHIAHLRGIDETTADFAEKAAREALEDAGIGPEGMDFFIVATDTPEFITPATSILLQGRFQKGERGVLSFDVGSSCAGFVTAFDTAARILETNPLMSHGVVVAVYNMPAFVRPGDSFGYSIFADGAAAFVIGRDQIGGSELVHSTFITDGTQWDYVGVYSGGTRKPVTKELLDNEEYGLQLLQRLPGDRNVKLWPPLVRRLLDEGGKSLGDVAQIIFTQINRSVILEVMDILGLPEEKTTTIMDRYGYTGNACVAMALYHAVKEGKVRRGDTVMLVASGAGFAVGSNLLIF